MLPEEKKKYVGEEIHRQLCIIKDLLELYEKMVKKAPCKQPG